MKVIVDINKKTLKMLDNNRAVFKGEYGADKLQLYINKDLENEYPVITGLLSNGRRIGAFTTDDSYEFETIDGVEYTRADFTLSKENGFSLSEGLTQITIWIYRTKDTTIVSKEAIGNVVFTVVNTTAFNDGDVIISGDVEGTVVNLKVEMENLQAKTEQYLPLTGGKPMTGDLKMKDKQVKFTGEYADDNMQIGYDDEKMKISIHNQDHYTASYTSTGFTVGNDYKTAELDITENRFTFTQSNQSTDITTDGFAVNNEEKYIFISANNITRYTDNYSNFFEYQYPNESGTLETKENVNDLFAKNLTKENLSEIIKVATQSLSGLMSSEDKKHLDTLVALLEEKENDNVVNTINEILAIFNQYPEGVEILSVLSEKVNKSELLPIIEEHSVKSKTIEIGSSTNCNFDNDSQIPTSKAVGDNFQPKLIAGENITIKDNVISATGGSSGGLYTQYFYIMIKENDGNEGYYTISMQTSKPITTVEEFRDYIRNSLIYTDGPNYKVTTIYFMEHSSTKPSWLIFDCAYYGSINCSIYYLDYFGEITDIITSTNISVITGRILHFSVLNTVAI